MCDYPQLKANAYAWKVEAVRQSMERADFAQAFLSISGFENKFEDDYNLYQAWLSRAQYAALTIPLTVPVEQMGLAWKYILDKLCTQRDRSKSVVCHAL